MAVEDAGLTRIVDRGFASASFGVAAGVFALFFFSDVPRVRKDIMIVMRDRGQDKLLEN